jgi:hypothetical protein
VDDWGRVFILDGFYKPNFDYTLQPAAMLELQTKYVGLLRFSNDRRINADPAIFKKVVIAGQKKTGDTVAKLLAELGVPTRPATNHILPGIAKINSYLSGRPDVPHPVTGELNSPLLYIAADLDWFEDEIINYYWKKNPHGQSIDEPQEHNDHAMNAAKYLLAFSPHPSQIIPPRHAMPPSWMQWQEYEEDRYGNPV